MISSQHSINLLLEPIYQLNDQVKGKIEDLLQLKVNFQEKTNQSFWTTFAHIMKQLTDQIAALKKEVELRDENIIKEHQYQQLSKVMNFYRQQCFTLEKQLNGCQTKFQNQLKELKTLKNENQNLRFTLIKKTKQIQKYKYKKSQQEQKSTNLNESNYKSVDLRIRPRVKTESTPKKQINPFLSCKIQGSIEEKLYFKKISVKENNNCGMRNVKNQMNRRTKISTTMASGFTQWE